MWPNKSDVAIHKHEHKEKKNMEHEHKEYILFFEKNIFSKKRRIWKNNKNKTKTPINVGDFFS